LDCDLKNEVDMALDRKFIATSSDGSDSDVEDEYDTAVPPKYIDDSKIPYESECNRELTDYKSREEDKKDFLNGIDRLSKGTISQTMFTLTVLFKLCLPHHLLKC
jgi:hypothetical protein